jgi:bifunctional non-homologous end joining protein LigD
MPTDLVARSPVPSAGLPDVKPVNLTLRTEPFDGTDWMFEPQYEGVRGLLYGFTDGCEIRSPWGDHFEGYADLCERVRRVLGGREVIVDGEIVSLDPRGKPNLRELLKGRGYLAFAAFDLLWLDGDDLRGLPLLERKRRLAGLLPSDTGPLYKVFTLEEHGRALYQAAKKMDLEGVVAKRKSDPYGSETLWYRVRNPAHVAPWGKSEKVERAETAER